MASRPRNSQDCFREAAEAAGRKLGPDALEEYFFKSQGRINRYVNEGLSLEAAAIRAGTELGDEARIARAIEKRQARINQLTQRGLRAREMPDRLLDTAVAVVDGVENKGAFRNAALSLRAMGDARAQKATSAFFHDLQDAGLVDVFKGHWWRGPDPAFERDVANELGRIDDPTFGRNTGNGQAKKMAEIIHRHQDALRLAANDAGAFVGKLDQYLAHQSHDRFKIKKAGYQAWRDSIAPKLSERTFQDMLPEDTEKFLRGVYNNLATGIHTGAEQGDWIAGFKGPANLAKKMSAERKLFFKDADAWTDYNREFGNGSLNGTVLSTLERGSRSVEAMQLLGTNPRAMLAGWIDDMAVRARDSGTPEGLTQAEALVKQQDRLLRLYDIAMRAPRAIENDTMATFFANLRTWQRFKLGSAMWSSIPDLAATASMAKHNDIGAMESLSWSLSQMFPKGEGRKAAMREANIGFGYMVQSLQTRFGAEDGVNGMLAKAVDVQTRLSALPWWTQNMKDGNTLMLLHNTAARAHLSYGALGRRYQTTLRRFGIEEAEWDALRQTTQKAPDGNNYIFAGDIASLPDAAVLRLAGRGDAATMVARKAELEQALVELFKHHHKQAPGPVAADYRAEIKAIDEAANTGREILRQKYEAYISDNVQEGMSEATAKVGDMLGHGATSGVMKNELWRTVLQFKQFPMTFVFRSLVREWGRDGKDISGMAQLIAGSTLFGYLAASTKDMLRGKEPFNPFNPEGYTEAQYGKNVMRAMVQGGGLGLYGDFLLGEVSRTGVGPLAAALGPAAGMADNMFNALVAKPREAALAGRLTAGGFGADVLQQAKSNAPFINLFWARTAMDYGVLYSLQETLNPGFLARTERRSEQQTGQKYLLSPQNTLPRYLSGGSLP